MHGQVSGGQADNASLYDTFNLWEVFGFTPQLTLSVCRGILLGVLIGSAIWLAVAVSVARLVG